jgi:hypothetical protein
MGAYDEAHWQTVVAELKPDVGVLLDPSVDTAQHFGDGSVTGSVARAVSFPWTGAHCRRWDERRDTDDATAVARHLR